MHMGLRRGDRACFEWAVFGTLLPVRGAIMGRITFQESSMRYASLHLAAAAAGFALLALPSQALEQPKRKAGLWEIKAQAVQGQPPMVMQQCTSDAYEAQMQKEGLEQSKSMCSKTDIRQEGGKIVADSVCKVGNSTVTSQSVSTGDFSTGYRVEVKSTFNPPMDGLKGSTSVFEARWLGPCLPGQKPGDMVMPGMKMPKSR